MRALAQLMAMRWSSSSTNAALLAALLLLPVLLSGCGGGGGGSTTSEVVAETTTTFLGISTTGDPTPPPTVPPPSVGRDAIFLMQATFGPTRSSLAELATKTDYKQWIQDQMALPAGSHREYYRARVNSRTTMADFQQSHVVEERSRCSLGSLWHRYAFTAVDIGKQVVADGSTITIDGTVRTSIHSTHTENGLQAPNSCTNEHPRDQCGQGSPRFKCKWGNSFWTENQYCQQWCWDSGFGYGDLDCSAGWPALNFQGYICAVEEKVGGLVTLDTRGSCSGGDRFDYTTMKNPAIWMQDAGAYTSTAATFSQAEFSQDAMVLAETQSPCSFGEFIETGGLVFRHYPRFYFLENTLESPNSGAIGDLCIGAPKTFLNEASCHMVPNRCGSGVQDTYFELTTSALSTISAASGRYVYYITGLQEDRSPCGSLSRWVQLDCGSVDCTPTTLTGNNANVIRSALRSTTGNIRDITPSCNRAAVPAGAKVDEGNGIFQHVHLNEYNVYDFTAWSQAHPGGVTAITQWATGSFEIKWQASHDMERWQRSSVRSSLALVGTLGKSVSFADIPTELQMHDVAVALFGSTQTLPYAWSCGSPGEIASQPVKGHQYPALVQEEPARASDDTLDTPYYRAVASRQHTKGTVWVMQALYAADQLRQRMAWALSQIFVTGVPAFGEPQATELWISYYDIFVRNAFGNYRDILKEVTYSPLMGNYLSFIKSWSFDQDGNYPDENYAREIMQLFSIGLWKLNPDGSKQTDAQGNQIPTYSNNEIMEFARVFTGFDYQLPRANYEEYEEHQNFIDPMQMRASRHDVYPKMDLDGGYLGDRYPLCEDLPADAFLAAGATFELEGISAVAHTEVMELTSGSALYTALCGSSSAPCSFEPRVTLQSTLTCTGDECKVAANNLEILKVDTAFYRYVSPVCVNLYFFADGVTTITQDVPYTRTGTRVCSDPKLAVAGSACCNGCDNEPNNWLTGNSFTCESAESSYITGKCTNNDNWIRNGYCAKRCWQEGLAYADRGDCSFGDYQEQRGCSFPRERLNFMQAEQKCSDSNMQVCWQQTAPGCSHEAEPDIRLWMPLTCSVNVSISADGLVSSLQTSRSAANPLRVAWTNSQYPQAAAAPSECSVGRGQTLECRFTVETQTVFSSVPSAADLLDRLKIGAHVPTISCTQCSGEVRSYTASGSIDENTVFEYQGRFFRNVEVLVVIGSFSFRNPPAFLVAEYPTEKAALAELDALLDHLSMHPNTAPFISRVLIQRFVTSTPSPTYLGDVADAFRTGTYDGVTYSGEYGDLGATVAAILLHPEARGATNFPQSTGKLREPLVKMMHLMRAMEYSDKEGREVIMQPPDADSLRDVIGQWPYHAPRVFNFYTPDYRPAGWAPGLSAPEFEIFTPPFIIGWMNGVFDMIEMGLNRCDTGFGMNVPSCNNAPDYNGVLNFTEAAGQDVIEELSILLTGGRLGPSKEIVRDAYNNAEEGKKLQAAQKAVVLTPEFNTLGDMESTGDREEAAPAQGVEVTDDVYKAVILVFLRGGADTFNMLVPLSCDLTNEYQQVRTSVALDPNILIPISTSGQSCSSFGLHPALPFLQELYNDGDLAFASNIGNLVEPLTQQEWKDGGKQLCSGLFSHADQVSAAQSLQCQSTTTDVGFGGLMGDVLASKGFTTQSFSVAGNSLWSVGRNTAPVIIDDKKGAVYLTRYEETKDLVRNVTKPILDNVYAEGFSREFWNGIQTMEDLRQTYANATVTTEFSTESSISRQLYQVARTISTRKIRGVQRDLFYVELDGFDHHADEELEKLADLYGQLNGALQSFVTEMRAQGLFNNVVVASGSDFGRTLTSNGEGTDHAYAGQHFVLGGRVRGGSIHNDYPSSLVEGSEQDIGRGRLLPKYPLENLYAPVAEWLGLSQSELSTPFRNFNNFNPSQDILSRSTLFSN